MEEKIILNTIHIRSNWISDDEEVEEEEEKEK